MRIEVRRRRVPRVIAFGLAFPVALWLSAAVAGPAAAEPRADGGAASLTWERQFERALSRARLEKKPLLIDFWATWCGPCREMEVELWSRADVVALAQKFVCARVDADHDPAVMRRYRAEGLPTVVVSDPWGTEIARRVGYNKPEEHLTMLKGVPRDFSPIAVWQERLAADPKDADALGEIGRFYYRAGIHHTSKEYLERALRTDAAKSDPHRLADTLTAIGWNDLRIGNARQARRQFEECLAKVPSHPGLDVTLYGLFRACVAQEKRADAEACLGRLASACPASPLVEQARQDLVHLLPR